MKFSVKTKGHYDYIDITPKVKEILDASDANEGIAVIFVGGSTAAVTTMEFEEGIHKDLTEVFENLAPEDAEYEHHKKWGDKNGAAHIKSAIVGTSITVPIVNAELALGTWQQITLIDFDEKPREREITVKILK